MLQDELEQFLEEGSEEEKEMLALTLAAIKYKREKKSPYIEAFLGLEGEFIDKETYQHVIPITSFMMNSLNIVHGGFTATLADCTMGQLVNESLPNDLAVVTSEMKINFIGPGKGSKLISKAKLVSLGKTLCVTECRIETDQGRLVAIATGTFFIIRKKKEW